MAQSFVTELFDFIDASPTSFHAVENLKQQLKEAGFTELQEGGEWSLQSGGKYFVTRNLSSLIAFVTPTEALDGARIIAAHSDSPTFKIKENAELSVRGKYTQLNTERYGGMLLSTWFDRPLSVAGRVLVRTEDGMETRLVNVDRDLAVIPNVAIHMNREINDGYKYNAQTDLPPLFGADTAKGAFRKLIAEAAHTTEENILGNDLFLYPRIHGTTVGAQAEYILSPRLDDLGCVFTGLTAFLSAKQPAYGLNVLCVFDNEEVGSGTKQGADSAFLDDVLTRSFHACGNNGDARRKALAASFMLSADNAHAVHPNHPEKTDAENCVYMNEGIVIKFNANQRYTTDAVSAALFHRVLDDHKIPYQHFANRSDMAGGGTLGNISSSHVSINTLDIGMAQLAMHSCCETAGAKDLSYMIDGMKAFYELHVRVAQDGAYLFN